MKFVKLSQNIYTAFKQHGHQVLLFKYTHLSRIAYFRIDKTAVERPSQLERRLLKLKKADGYLITQKSTSSLPRKIDNKLMLLENKYCNPRLPYHV